MLTINTADYVGGFGYFKSSSSHVNI